MKYIVSYKESGERLDKAVALLNQDLSRSYIAKLLKDGKILTEAVHSDHCPVKLEIED